MRRSVTEIFFLVIFISLLFVFLILGLIAEVVLFDVDFGTPRKTKPQYVMSEFDELDNTTSKSIVMLSKSLKKLEYFSYRNEKGKFVLITNFGKDDYECTGTCFCESEKRRNSILSKSLIFIISAASFASAVHFSSAYFQNACLMSYSNKCPSGSTTFEVDDCKIKQNIPALDLQYKCGGYCSPDFIKELEHAATLALQQDRIDCPAFYYSGSVIASGVESAKFVFVDSYLQPFCEEVGLAAHQSNGFQYLVSLCYGTDINVECFRDLS